MVIVKGVIAIVKITVSVSVFAAKVLAAIIIKCLSLALFAAKILFFSTLLALASVLAVLAAEVGGVAISAVLVVFAAAFLLAAVIGIAVLAIGSVVISAGILVLAAVVATAIAVILAATLIPVLALSAAIFGAAAYIDALIPVYGELISIYMSGILASTAMLQAAIYSGAGIIVAAMATAVGLILAELAAIILGLGVIAGIFGIFALILYVLISRILPDAFADWFGIKKGDDGKLDTDTGPMYMLIKFCPNWIQEEWKKIEAAGGVVNWFNGFVGDGKGGGGIKCFSALKNDASEVFKLAGEIKKQVVETVEKFVSAATPII